MPRTIVLDAVEPTQVILMRDTATGKVLVQATYRVKAGSEVAKTVPDRRLTFTPGPAPAQPSADLMSASEQAAASSAWDAVQTALNRLELS